MAQSNPGEGRLTTHVLDTARGKPAAGMKIDLFRLDGGSRVAVKSVTTNSDGRVDGPVLSPGEIAAGIYELVFHAGAYLRAAGDALTEPAFLDEIPIRFGISDAGAHYHVPLLISAYGYSTYRGS
jgi:hydroxyisourate hydrolase